MNPHAVYVRCDAGMDYDSKNTGGVGVSIEFPEQVGIPSSQNNFGSYESANIERLELEAMIRGGNELLQLTAKYPEEARKINAVIVTTDRAALDDSERTNAFRIRAYRRNRWRNHEDKEVKNSDLLNDLDKVRAKVAKTLKCSVGIKYQPRRHNVIAHGLAKQAKARPPSRRDIGIKGQKIGRRKFQGREVVYNVLRSRELLSVRVFMKIPAGDRWETSAEIVEGKRIGSMVRIYIDNLLENKMHRHRTYIIKIKSVFRHHITIFRTINEKK